MHDAAIYTLVPLIVLITHFQEGITGFGCTVLALPFVTLLVGLNVAVPVLVIQGWLIAVLILLESRRDIVWSEFFHILVLAGCGLPFGMWLAMSLAEAGLTWVLAVFMVIVGGAGFVRQYTPGGQSPVMTRRTRILASLFLPLGGLIHGAFGTGGPLVVIYAARALTDKKVFRVTLCMLWAVLNTILIVQWLTADRLTPHIWRMTALCVPFTLLGFVLGNHVHYRINESTFRRVIYAVLAFSGCVLIWSMLR
jgi:uncharacterized protein